MKIKELHWNKELCKIDKNLKGDFQVYTGSYSFRSNGEPLLHLYGREVAGKRIRLNIIGFLPYFYFGNSKKKSIYREPFRVKEVRKEYKKKEKLWEADVPFVKRFLIDANLPQTYVYPRILYLDTEVNMTTSELLCCSFKINDEEIVTKMGENEIKKYLEFLVKEEKFDGIAGWNINFDLDYLKERLKFNPSRNYFILDVYYAFRDFWHEKEGLPDYTLKTVGKYLTGIEKKQIKNILDFNEDELIDYNKKDVEILYKIDFRLKISRVYSYIAFLNKSLMEDSFSKFRIGDIALLREARKQNIILPTCYHSKKIKETFKGAYVLAKPGLFKDIAIFDIASAYPSAILERNISFENAKKYNNKVEFDNSKKGLIPSIIELLINERKKYPKGTFENLAFKRISNAIYGLFGMPMARMYDAKVAGEVTRTIREIFEKLNEFLTHKNYNVIYIDTDSCFISDIKEEDIGVLQEEIQKFIYNSFSYSKIKINFEDFFPKGYIISKKQYYLQDGERTKERGLPLRRGDTSIYLKRKYKKVLDGLLQGEDSQVLLKNILVEIQNELKDVPIRELATPKGFNPHKKYKVVTQQEKAFRYSEKFFNLSLAFGEKIKILPIKEVAPIFRKFPATDVLALPDDLKLIEDFVIDYERLKESIINRIYLLFPTLEETKNETIQQSLSLFQ